MTRKALPITELKDGLANSPFFKRQSGATTVSRHHDTVIPRHHDTTTPREEEGTSDRIETIRSAVRQFGKESATQRLTTAEKQDLRDIEYSYNKQGIHTTGNEIIRIAINALILDYKEKGEESTLAQVLKKLKE